MHGPGDVVEARLELGLVTVDRVTNFQWHLRSKACRRSGRVRDAKQRRTPLAPRQRVASLIAAPAPRDRRTKLRVVNRIAAQVRRDRKASGRRKKVAKEASNSRCMKVRRFHAPGSIFEPVRAGPWSGASGFCGARFPVTPRYRGNRVRATRYA